MGILPAQLESKKRGRDAHATKPPLMPPTAIVSGGLRFASPKPAEPKEKPKREKRAKVKNDPALVAAARELRDRWLERVNADPQSLPANGKYSVARALTASVEVGTIPALPEPGSTGSTSSRQTGSSRAIAA